MLTRRRQRKWYVLVEERREGILAPSVVYGPHSFGDARDIADAEATVNYAYVVNDTGFMSPRSSS